MQKGRAGKWVVFAFEDEGGTNPGEPVTAGAAAITANLRLDGAAANAVDDTNPTELEDGYYVFDITAAEADADNIVICPASSTANVNVIGCPPALWTTPPYFGDAVAFGTCETGTLTTTSFSTSLTESVDDAVNNLSVKFIGNVTAALRNQGGVISDYATTNGVVTISTALTTAPANGDIFIYF